jgi:hypothetical protein
VPCLDTTSKSVRRARGLGQGPRVHAVGILRPAAHAAPERRLARSAHCRCVRVCGMCETRESSSSSRSRCKGLGQRGAVRRVLPVSPWGCRGTYNGVQPSILSRVGDGHDEGEHAVDSAIECNLHPSPSHTQSRGQRLCHSQMPKQVRSPLEMLRRLRTP